MISLVELLCFCPISVLFLYHTAVPSVNVTDWPGL